MKAKLTKNRNKIIKQYINNKKVLNMGCVGNQDIIISKGMRYPKNNNIVVIN